MIYTVATKKALKLMFEAHKEQVDKSGLPYVFHPYHLAEQMQEENAVIVALLHDLVEDTDYRLEDLKAMGFSGEVCDAIELMTHQKGVGYFDYIHGIKQNPLARMVKLADLKHNSDLTRLDSVKDKDKERLAKYQKAIEILEGNET